MVLPSKKTLAVRRNQHFGRGKIGFQEHTAQDIAGAVKTASKECDKLVVIALDEMSVKG